MSTRERFGKYLLLKKLTEDPLGETFRAGMLGKDGIERVVLLRIFNGQAIDPQRLWDVAKERIDLPPLLRSPNLGEGVEMGELQGIPYMAYDYISGKNLAVLLQQAARKNNFIPAEHALLISERIALALVVAAEVRHGGDRVTHGFLVPHLVMISNEGETRLLGFEVATGTRSFAANPLVRRHFGRYLSPEALNGAPPHKSDDIYSLGVMLFELLTGRPLPPPAAEGFAPVIDQGVLATEGTPIMPELSSLLKQSLVARDHRIQDVATWHKTLSKWMFDGQYNPTTFNLAFYMHNLFRDEIERESQEIEVEKTLSLPVVPQQQQPTPAPTAKAEPPSVMATQPITAIAEEPAVASAEMPEEPEKKSKTGLFIGLAAALIAAAAGGYFWMNSQNTPAQPVPVVQPPPPEPLPEETEEIVDAGPSEQELALQTQIEDLIAQRASAMEQQIRSDYDKQLKDLQTQLDDARKIAQERERAQREAAQKVKDEEEARIAEEKAAQEKKEKEAALAAAQAAAEKEADKTTQAPEKVAQATPPPPKVTPPPPPPPTRPQVRRGDLVEPGPGVVQPRMTRQVSPRFPEIARRLNKPGATVLVRVLIDENGEVLKAEISGKEQGFGFDSEALQAAKRTAWAPATKDNVPVKMWSTMSVVFQR